jgi:hypothetical protein
VADFGEHHFAMREPPGSNAGWIELERPAGGGTIAPAQRRCQTEGPATVKTEFGTADPRTFVAAQFCEGLKFGIVHEADGVEFANLKDPADNSIRISSRGIAP